MLTHTQPTIDMITLSIRYGKKFTDKVEWELHCQRLNHMFNVLCKIIESDVGYSLQNLPNDKVYIPKYGIYLSPPDAQWGYGRIYLHPTKHRLHKLQDWLSQCFYKNLNKIVNLCSIELAWDFHNPNLSMQDYEKLALRVGARLLPKSIVNPFTIAIIGRQKRCNDNAINGCVTVYVQSTEKRGSSKNASALKYKTKSSGHTKIYAKAIAKKNFLRIEHRLDKGKAKRNGIVFDPTNFTQIMDLPNLQISHFFTFKSLDIPKFKNALNPQPGIRGLRRRLWQNALAQSPSLTTADATRLMRIASRGSKELAGAVKKATKTMTMEDAIKIPLPSDFYIAQRMGIHVLPNEDELPSHIELAPFEHEPELRPERVEELKLRISSYMPQNRSYSALTDTQNKNAEKTMDIKQNTPSKANEIEMQRTKWPDDGVCKIVDLPVGTKIVGIAPDIHQKGPHLARTGTKTENAVKTMRRTKWPQKRP